MTASLAVYLQTQIPDFVKEDAFSNNLGLYLLINLNIVVVMLLCFLVSRNILKLLLDRRKNIIGAQLRTRLVVAFVGLSLVPTVLLFLTAKGILDSVLRGWFSPQIQATVDGALEVAEQAYLDRESRLMKSAITLSEEVSKVLEISGDFLSLTTESPGLRDQLSPSESESPIVSRPQALEAPVRHSKKLLEAILQEKLKSHQLTRLTIYDSEGRSLLGVSSRAPGELGREVPPLNLFSLGKSLSGEAIVHPEQNLQSEFIRAYQPVLFEDRPGFSLVATVRVDEQLAGLLGGVLDSYEDYRDLHSYRTPLASSYLLTLVGASLLIMFAAVWVGFHLARSLSIPIQKLAEATEQIAHGNLDHRVPEIGDDELGVLAHSFNTMTSDLKRTTGELDSRRQYIEAVLGSIEVGILSVDRHGCVTTCNESASKMLGVLQLGEKLSSASLKEVAEQLSELLESLFESDKNVISDNVSVGDIKNEGGARHLHVTLTKLFSRQGAALGAVVLMDDLSELVKAQRMAAWRDVARRIAHEIKNPLTPIQLSAQRLQRRVIEAGILNKEQESIATDCTKAIVGQVETLRTLVNEFSQFATMPQISPKPVCLNTLVRQAVSVYEEHSGAESRKVEGHLDSRSEREVDFQLELEKSLPLAMLDKDQISRVVVNLIDNALESIRVANRSREKEGIEVIQPRVKIATSLNRDLSILSLSLADNGLGFSDTDKSRAFEPYFSTRETGTGLGLAIVRSIVSDHNGHIRIKDNKPHGAMIVIEIPWVLETNSTLGSGLVQAVEKDSGLSKPGSNRKLASKDATEAQDSSGIDEIKERVS